MSSKTKLGLISHGMTWLMSSNSDAGDACSVLLLSSLANDWSLHPDQNRAIYKFYTPDRPQSEAVMCAYRVISQPVPKGQKAMRTPVKIRTSSEHRSSLQSSTSLIHSMVSLQQSYISNALYYTKKQLLWRYLTIFCTRKANSEFMKIN
jgi:hypothetical protein